MGILKLKNQHKFTLDAASIQGHENELEIRSETLEEFHLDTTSFSLRKIGLYCPKLKYVDASIWNLPQLEILAIKSQKISCELFSTKKQENLAPLRMLRLSGLELNSIPAWLSQLNALQELDLNNNRLNELPLELIQLKKLSRINLEQNHFKKIPVCLTRMPWLNHLALDNNPLSEQERQLAFDLWGIWF